MKITLKQLLVFDAVARLNSVSHAAKEIHLSQSAATLSLQDLEENLGVMLFDRRGKRLLLNENGRRLQPHARSLLSLANEVESQGTSGPAGVLRIAASGTIGDYIMPKICASFLGKYPHVQVKLTVLNEPEIIEDLENLVFDVGFIEGVSMRYSLEIEQWIADEMIVVATPNHWAAQKRVSMKDLMTERWFLHPIGSPGRHAFTAPYAKLLMAQPQSIRFETNSTEAIKRAAQAGAGIGCLSKFAVADELRHGELIQLNVKGMKIRRQFHILQRKEVYKRAAHDAFLREVRQFSPG